MRRIGLLILSGFGEAALTPTRIALVEDGDISYPDREALEAIREEVRCLKPVEAYFIVEFNHIKTVLTWEVPEGHEYVVLHPPQGQPEKGGV